MKKLFYVAIIVLSLSTLNAQQFNLQAELRPRFENKHGFQTLLNTGADGTNFISQRTRLNLDRKSTRLNSSHITISYAVFCLKKKTKQPLS